MEKGPRLVKVGARSGLDAQVIAAVLADAGIPHFVYQPQCQSRHGHGQRWLSATFEVGVPVGFAEAATRAIEAIPRVEVEPPVVPKERSIACALFLCVVTGPGGILYASSFNTGFRYVLVAFVAVLLVSMAAKDAVLYVAFVLCYPIPMLLSVVLVLLHNRRLEESPTTS